jgi:ubiquinone/menaquinone biosynthesis C-methylase UbiE
VREMARVLRPGGVALIVDMVEHDRAAYRQQMGHRWLGFGVPQLVRMLGEAGLDRARISVLPAASDAKGPGLLACTGRKPG